MLFLLRRSRVSHRSVFTLGSMCPLAKAHRKALTQKTVWGRSVRGATSFIGKNSWSFPHISISSIKELHGKGCQPNSHGLEFIDNNSPIFISRYCLFTIPTSSLKIADLLLFCCYHYNPFSSKVNKIFSLFLYFFLYLFNTINSNFPIGPAFLSQQ